MKQLHDERSRLKALSVFEDTVRAQGYSYIAGVDEAGRGPLAGPVVAAACILPPDFAVFGIDDSKKLTPDFREKLYQDLKAHKEVVIGIGIVDAEEIDRINILQATFLAMKQAIENLAIRADYVLVDGPLLPPLKTPAKAIIKGDSRSVSIASASIIAKVIRDEIMKGYDKTWPEYGFGQHKGYGTKSHRMAIQKYGGCSIHRKSFAPFKAEG